MARLIDKLLEENRIEDCKKKNSKKTRILSTSDGRIWNRVKIKSGTFFKINKQNVPLFLYRYMLAREYLAFIDFLESSFL